jgi:hypothetical protein
MYDLYALRTSFYGEPSALALKFPCRYRKKYEYLPQSRPPFSTLAWMSALSKSRLGLACGNGGPELDLAHPRAVKEGIGDWERPPSQRRATVVADRLWQSVISLLLRSASPSGPILTMKLSGEDSSLTLCVQYLNLVSTSLSFSIHDPDPHIHTLLFGKPY